MTNLLGLVNGVSTFVKVGWVCWLVWLVLQIKWYDAVRDLPEVPESVPEEPVGWPPISTVNDAVLLGSRHFWDPSPATDSPVAASHLATAVSNNTVPDSWGDLASDVLATAQSAATARRSSKKRRRAAANG